MKRVLSFVGCTAILAAAGCGGDSASGNNNALPAVQRADGPAANEGAKAPDAKAAGTQGPMGVDARKPD